MGFGALFARAQEKRGTNFLSQVEMWKAGTAVTVALLHSNRFISVYSWSLMVIAAIIGSL